VVEAASTIPQRTAVETLREAMRQGYTLTVRTRTEVAERPGAGTHVVTYADKLQIRGHKPVPPELRSAMVAHRDELLAAACVIRPPVPWVQILVERYLTGSEEVVRREGWKGPYRVRLAMVAANVAAFIGLHPAHDGERLEPIIEEALR
jgi:hypothetical protein